MQKRHPFLASLAIASLLITSIPARAAEFDPSLILTDDEVRNVRSMSYPEVVYFLRDKGGLLQVADTDPMDGLYKDAAQLIMDASMRYSINPRYIMAVLQKESSVVESPSPDPSRLIWAAGYALCDGCYKSYELALQECPRDRNPQECMRKADLAQKYKGFAKQVDAAAGWMDWYLKNAATNASFKKAGDVVTIGGSTFAVRSNATAALYSYTPHLHGNQLLWSVLNRWFGDGAGAIEEKKQKYPDGTVVRDVATGEIGVMQAGKLRAVSNLSVLSSRFGKVPAVSLPTATFASLKSTGHSRAIRFPDLSLVKDERGNIYLLVGTQKRRIASPQAFAKIGFNPEELEDASSEDLADYAEGEVIDVSSAPSVSAGSLLQDAKTGGVYFVENGMRHPIWDKALLSMRFAGLSVTPTAPAKLAAIPSGGPVLLPDGALVKSVTEPSVFLIGDGKRRSFVDEAAFFSVGYRWEDVVTVNSKLLALHPVGAPIEAVQDIALMNATEVAKAQ